MVLREKVKFTRKKLKCEGGNEGLRGKEQAQEAKEETKGLRGKNQKVQIE